MSTINRDRAEMAVAYGILHGKAHDQIVDMLDADGLLMPYLPERDEFGEWDMDPLVVRIDTATRDVCLEDTDPYEGRAIYMLPDKAREVALALLAAADYAERRQA